MRLRVWLAQSMCVVVYALLCLQPAPSYTLAMFGAPERVNIHGYDGFAMEPFVTPGGGALLFTDAGRLTGDADLHWAERIDDLNFEYRGRIPHVNSPRLESVPTMDLSGTLYFLSPRELSSQGATVWRARWYGDRAHEVELVQGLPHQPQGQMNFDIEISRDGENMVIAVGEFYAGELLPRQSNLLLAVRFADEFRRDPRSDEWLAKVNTSALEYGAALTADALELFFVRADPLRGTLPRLYHARRADLVSPFADPRPIDVAGIAEAPSLAADGEGLYFQRFEKDRVALYRIPRVVTRNEMPTPQGPRMPNDRDQASRKMKYTAPSMHRQAQA